MHPETCASNSRRSRFRTKALLISSSSRNRSIAGAASTVVACGGGEPAASSSRKVIFGAEQLILRRAGRGVVTLTRCSQSRLNSSELRHFALTLSVIGSLGYGKE